MTGPLDTSVLDWLLYLIGLGTLVGSISKFVVAVRPLAIPTGIAGCVYASLLLYLSALIPGALGVMNRVSVVVTLGLLAVLSHLGLNSLVEPASSSVNDRGTSGQSSDSTRRLSPRQRVFILLGVVLAAPIASGLRNAIGTMFDPGHERWTDTVSYHLPALVEFLQAGSLWSFEGPYQSYCYAFELIGGFPSHFFRSPWGLDIAHLGAIALLLLTLRALVGRFLEALSQDPDQDLPVFALSVGIWCVLFAPQITQVGGNDIFFSATALAALTFALEARGRTAGIDWQSRRRVVSLLAAASLGLALATKPTALAYIPAVALPFLLAWRNSEAESGIQRWAPALRSLLRLLSVSISIGGFFLVRNIIVLGTLADSHLGFAWQRTLIAYVFDTRFYTVSFERAVLVVCLAACLPLVRPMVRAGLYSRSGITLLSFLAFQLIGLAAFTVTPYSSFFEMPWVPSNGLFA